MEEISQSVVDRMYGLIPVDEQIADAVIEMEVSD